MLFDFNSLKNGISNFVNEARELNKTIEQKKRERELAEELPLPQSDFADMMCEWVDKEAASMPRLISDKLIKRMDLINRPRIDMTKVTLALFADDKGQISQPMYCFINRENIKTALRESIMSYDWPAEVGLSRAERKEKIISLDKEIEQLEIKAQEMHARAAELNIKL